MNTITLSKAKYENLEKKATLYDRLFRRISKSFFETEEYSSSRIKEFLSQDKISIKSRKKIMKLLK